MTHLLSVELPEEVMSFVRAEAAAQGMSDERDYVVALVKNERTRKAREQLAALLDEGLQGEASELTEEDWEALRRKVREHRNSVGDRA